MTDAILDTGATASFISSLCETARSLKQFTKPVKVVVNTADQRSLVADESIKTTLNPASLPSKGLGIELYALPGRYNIMGYEVILGLDVLHGLQVKIESSSEGMFASIDGQVVAKETKLLRNKSLATFSVTTPQPKVNKFELLAMEFKDIFAEKADTFINTSPMKVPLISDRAVKSRLRSKSQDDILEIDRQIQSMLANDIIEPSVSQYAANVLLVDKKNGSKRMCVDFRGLNEVTLKDGFPLPQIIDMFQACHGSTHFAALDCTEGFLQIPVLKEHRYRTAFITHHGQFHYKRVPFGFTNSPATFQRTMNSIFDRGLYRRCVIYIDDILVYAKSENELYENLKWVFERCRENTVKLKRSKCKINVQECEFLGFKISYNSISAVKGKYDPIGSMIPTREKDVRAILGALNHYARFIDKYADRTMPLRNLTRKDMPFKWSDELTQLVNQLKKELNNSLPQNIAHSKTDKRVDLFISPYSVEVMCFEGNDKLVGRAGQTFSDAEVNYTLVEQNLVGIALAYSKFDPILKGQVTFRTTCKDLRQAVETKNRTDRVSRFMLSLPPDCVFKVELIPGRTELETSIASETTHEELFYTDGACVRNGKTNSRASWAILATMNPNLSASGLVDHGRLTNQTAEVFAILKACETAVKQNFKNIIIVSDSKYAVGAIDKWIRVWKKNDWKDYRGKPVCNQDLLKQLANYLDIVKVQCLFVKGHSSDINNDKVDKMAKQVLEQENIKLGVIGLDEPLVNQDQDEEIDLIKANLAADPGLQDKFTIYNDELYYLDPKLPASHKKRLVVPQRDRKLVLRMAHDNRYYGGHLGVKKTRGKLEDFYWPGMSKDIERYVETCEFCQKHKTPKRPRYGLLQVVKPSELFERIHVDIVGPLRQCSTGKRYIITAIDAFSRYAYAKAVIEVKSKDLINFLKEEIFVKHGPPRKLVSDNGVQFTCIEFKEFITSLGIKHSKTCDYHPQSNGLDERLNGTLIRILKNYTKSDQSDWDKQLNAAIFVYNTTRHEAIQTSPYVAVYGVSPRSPLKLLEHEANEMGNVSDEKRHKTIREFIRKAQETAQQTQKKYYDAKRQEQHFKVFDFVKAKNHSQIAGGSKKLTPKWDLPCIVTQIIESDGHPVAAKVRNLETGKVRRTAFADLMPLEERSEDESEIPADDIPADVLQVEEDDFDPSIDELVQFAHAPIRVPVSNCDPCLVRADVDINSSSYDEIAVPCTRECYVPIRGVRPRSPRGSSKRIENNNPINREESVHGIVNNKIPVVSRSSGATQNGDESDDTTAPSINALTSSDKRPSPGNYTSGQRNVVPQSHSTPIALAEDIPFSLSGTTSLIAPSGSHEQVDIIGDSSTGGTQEDTHIVSRNRPRRKQKRPEYFQSSK